MKPKAALQIIHGMSEHISRYDEFAGFLCDRGFAVFGDDHLGHGDTVRNCGGIPGYFSEKDGERHSFDLCESCYDDLLRTFRIPAEIEE